MNLAVNARDAMPDGGMLTIETDNLTVPSASSGGPPGLEPGDYVRLRVRDTGAGMPEEVLTHVFEPFFTTKPVGQGTGLGLATVYGAVRQGGGHIWVDSAPGQGTTFTVCFPRSRGRVSRARREHGPDAGGGHENVLVVEDHPSVRALAMNVLRKAGYAVRAAGNGPEALRMVEREPGAIDLLVTDVVMPHMSGKEVAERLARERPGMRVLYVSGYPRGTGDHRVALQPGDEFLPKPFTGPQLLGKVREVLDRAAPR
jgi:CheY-like chemotaxis protein